MQRKFLQGLNTLCWRHLPGQGWLSSSSASPLELDGGWMRRDRGSVCYGQLFASLSRLEGGKKMGKKKKRTGQLQPAANPTNGLGVGFVLALPAEIPPVTQADTWPGHRPENSAHKSWADITARSIALPFEQGCCPPPQRPAARTGAAVPRQRRAMGDRGWRGEVSLSRPMHLHECRGSHRSPSARRSPK